MTTERYVADCAKFPSERNCTLRVAGSRDEVLDVLTRHAIDAHGHADTPGLRDELKNALEREDPSATQHNRELAHTLYEAFNRRDFAAIERAASPGFLLTIVATGEAYRGPAGLRRWVEEWAHAFPDARVEVQRIYAHEDGYVSEFVGSGTHAGPLHGPNGTIPPTGKRMKMRFSEVMGAKDGLLTEGRAYFDQLSMLAQLGLAPQPGAQVHVPPPGAQRPEPVAPGHGRH